MKVLLVYPPRTARLLYTGQDKLGLLYLASVLRNKGIDVSLYDADLERGSFDELRRVVKQCEPSIVGISVNTSNRFDAFKTARLVKSINKRINVIAGGPHVTGAPRDTLENVREIDIAVIGEGEYTLEEVCDTITNERPFDGVKGIAFRKEDEIIINPRRERISDLNKLPFPARDLLPHYRKRDKSVYYSISEMPDGTKMEFSNISIVTGRGCPFNCLFCAVPETWGKNVKFRSVENIIAEMKHLKRQYDVKRVFFCDDTFNANNERVAHLCTRILEERLDIKWNCQSRVDKVDQKILSLMKEAGCHMVSFGVESGSQHILDDVMSKGITIDGVKKVVKWCDEIGLARNCNFMYSLPGEDMKDLHKTLAFMKELGGKQSLGPTVILPGSRIEKIARTNGLLPENFSWSKISPYKYYEPTSNSFLPIFVDKLSWEEILNVFYKYIKGQSTVRTKNYIFRVAQRLFQVRSLVDLKYIFRNYFIFLKILYTNMFRKK